MRKFSRSGFHLKYERKDQQFINKYSEKLHLDLGGCGFKISIHCDYVQLIILSEGGLVAVIKI